MKKDKENPQPEPQAQPCTEPQPEAELPQANLPPTPPISPFRQRLAAHFADAAEDLTNDEVADRLACQWADELEQQLARFADTEGRLNLVLTEQPELATIVETMLADGLPLRVAIRRTLAPDALLPQPGDDDYAAFAEQREMDDAAVKQLDANLNESMSLLKQFAKEHKLDDAAQRELVDAINADFDNLLERRLTAEMLAGYRKRLRYDADVEEARSKGELAGRNANIEARMVADLAARQGDGLPQPHSGGYAPRMLKGLKPVIDFSKYQ